ncbi:MAG: hypothetical protein ACLQU1_26245 [Bryobacteraceae bacterium]
MTKFRHAPSWWMLSNRRIATLDLPGLIRAKRAAGREKDAAALPELESLLEAQER